jgi:hypothetical protein
MNALSHDVTPHLYLRTDLLRTGDVLLTYSDHPVSAGIASLTEGEFAHVALVISPGQLYEAEGKNGVALKTIKQVGLATLKGKPTVLGAIPGNPIDCKVLRHPALASLGQEVIDEALAGLYQDSHGLLYSTLERMVDLAKKLPEGARPALKKMAAFIDGLKTRTLHGYFCSEVVARFFPILGVPLFTDGRPPEDTIPNDLQARTSYLREVPDVVLQAGTVHLEPDDGLMPGLNSDNFNTFIEEQGVMLNKVARFSKLLNAQTRQMNEQLQDQLQRKREKTVELLLKLPETYQSLLAMVEAASASEFAPPVMERGDRYLNRLADQIMQAMNCPHPRTAALTELSKTNAEIVEVTRSALRKTVLFSSSGLKLAVKNLPAGEIRDDLQNTRRQTLRDGRSFLLSG